MNNDTRHDAQGFCPLRPLEVTGGETIPTPFSRNPPSRRRTTMRQKEYREKRGLGGYRHPSHTLTAAYVIPKIEEFCRDLSMTHHTRLLDVGCGTGSFTYYFSKLCDTWGVDDSEALLGMNPCGKKILMSPANLALPDDSFDVVFCHALLHHLENIAEIGGVIREMRRVSRDYVIMVEPNIHNPLMFLFSLLVREERNALRFSLNYLRDMAVQNELSIVDSFSCGLTVPYRMPLWMLSLTQLFDIRCPCGMTNVVIGRKRRACSVANGSTNLTTSGKDRT